MASDDAHGPIRAALEVTLGSDARLQLDKHAALVALCRVSADRIDEAGRKVPTHLIAAYLSALKDVGRVLGDDKPVEDAGKLGRLRSAHKSAA